MSAHPAAQPTKWRPLLVVGGVVGLTLTAWLTYMRPAPEGAEVRVGTPRTQGEVGGEGSPRYNQLMTAQNYEEAQQAELRGHSYAAQVVGRDRQAQERETLKIPDCPAPPPVQPPDNARVAAMTQAMARLLQATDLRPQQLVPVTAPKAQPVAAVAPPAGRPLPAGLKPGAVLYAVNDLRVTSTIANVPVIATVVQQGPLKGARLAGRFQVADERLVVQFTQLSLQGVSYAVDALAIDPAIPAGDIASDVDHHYLLRWGSLLAGSFLEGMGATARAMAESGERVSYGSNSVVVSRPELDAEKQLKITAGTMGERVGSVLQQNFNIPTTITLNPGQEMGVLILRAE